MSANAYQISSLHPSFVESRVIFTQQMDTCMSDHDFQAEKVDLHEEIKIFKGLGAKNQEDEVKFSSKSVQNTN
jgi:hypothetical protein